MLLAACSGSASEQSTADGSSPWSYAGDTGPEHWGSLEPEFAECSTGRRQSPISIENPTPEKRPKPNLSYRGELLAEVENNGHSVEAQAGPGNTMSLADKAHALQYMHFHSPAETIIEGVTNPVELHYVHQSASGDYAVFALLLKEGQDNPGFQPFVDTLRTPKDSETIVKLPWARMVPESPKTVRFNGSLTTPECSEGLLWFVATDPVEISASQIASFQAAYNDNARPVQPTNGRSITVDSQ